MQAQQLANLVSKHFHEDRFPDPHSGDEHYSMNRREFQVQKHSVYSLIMGN